MLPKLAAVAALGFFALGPALVQAAPSDSDWRELHKAVGGNLFKAEPLARPCFSVFNGKPVKPDHEKCAAVQESYRNGTIKTSSYPGFVHTYNEACASNVTDQCLLLPNDKLATGPCNQGILSERYIAVTSAKDAQAAFHFARRTGITLSIKATGHDYASRSSRKGSLALWTRNLNTLEKLLAVPKT